MRKSYKETIVINSNYSQISNFLKKLPDVFLTSGNTTYEGRNTIKTFEVDGITLNVKSFQVPHFINQFAYATLRESKAKRSYTYAKRLLEMGINTPTPIAYIEYKRPLLFKNSFYISEHIDIDNELRVLRQGTLDEHRDLLVAFAKFTAKLHNLKVLHLDFSAGNIMYKRVSNEYKFYLVDLNRMEFDKEISKKESAHNFSKLWGSNEMIALFATEYAKERDFDIDQFLPLVFKYRERFWTNFSQKYSDATPYIGDSDIKK